MRYSMARTVPEEDHENYMTEKEAKEMVNGFNSHLKSLTLQLEELEKLNQTLKLKIEREVNRNENFREAISSEKQKNLELQNQIERKHTELLKIEGKIQENSKDLHAKGFQEVSENWEQAEDLLEYLVILEKTFIVLSTTAELQSKRLNDKKSEMNSDAVCVNCKEKYVLLLNDSKSCSYHPGQLKYFSCRGCGADPYFACCLKCKSCSKGCKVTHHRS